jgi:transcription elongation GreA/GreB family factor
MVGNEVYFAISAQTPIYIALKGKKVGDTITINGQTQTIKEVM